MSDLRKAAEMALEALEDYRFASSFERPLAQDAIDELRQALAQPSDSVEQEPVAWFVQYEYRHEFLWRKPNELEQDTALEITPLYTAPPKREWVGLTRMELDIATLGLEDLGDCYVAIEAKLKEKNGG